jgi:hypothetical protein
MHVQSSYSELSCVSHGTHWTGHFGGPLQCQGTGVSCPALTSVQCTLHFRFQLTICLIATLLCWMYGLGLSSLFIKLAHNTPKFVCNTQSVKRMDCLVSESLVWKVTAPALQRFPTKVRLASVPNVELPGKHVLHAGFFAGFLDYKLEIGKLHN